jgi:acetylornithine deacetylase/succinyl-diaminopimelate desuccinylase-like protein
MSIAEDALALIDPASITQLARDMIDIHSPVGGEAALAQYLAARLCAAGLRVETREVEPNRFNVLGRLEGSGGGPSLLYAGHLDSAYGGDEEGIAELGPGYQPKSWVEDDWIFGLGAYNMKSGHAAAILAIEALARSKARLRGDVMIAGVVGETCHVPVAGYQGARYRGCGIGARFMVASGLTADMCVVPEPTSNRISVTSGGYVYFELTTRANPGATYRRGGRIAQVNTSRDAIDKMFDVATSLKRWGAGYAADKRYKGQPSGYASVIAIEGGHPFRPTKLACACRLYFEVGTMPGEHHADVVENVRACTRELGRAASDIDVEVKVVQTAHGAEVSPEATVVTALSAAHEAVWGHTPEVTWDGWYADTAPLTQAGIPAICYGPQGRSRNGGNGYASEGEHAHIGDLTRGAQVFVRMAADVCMRDRRDAVGRT